MSTSIAGIKCTKKGETHLGKSLQAFFDVLPLVYTVTLFAVDM